MTAPTHDGLVPAMKVAMLRDAAVDTVDIEKVRQAATRLEREAARIDHIVEQRVIRELRERSQAEADRTEANECRRLADSLRDLAFRMEAAL